MLYYDYECYVTKIRETFLAHCPKAKLSLKSYQLAQLERDFFKGVLDVALIYSATSNPQRGIETLPFLKFPLAVLLDGGHRLASKANLCAADLQGERMLFPAMTLNICQTDKIVFNYFKQNGTQIGEPVPIDNFDEVPYLLKESQGIYITSIANGAHKDSVEHRYLEPNNPLTSVSAVWLTENNNPAITTFLNIILICYL